MLAITLSFPPQRAQPTARGDGPYTLWVNESGVDLTAYAI